MRKTGTYKTLSEKNFFIPDPLPPANPPLNLDQETITLYGQAMLQLGKLKEITKRIPNIQQFIKAYVKKEAQLSSQIEGINTTLLEIFTQSLPGSKIDKNSQLVLNYSKAIYSAIKMIKDENMPISSRVILNAHKELMQTGHGDKSDPGNFRRQMVAVGNLTPAQPSDIPSLVSDLENFINLDTSIAPLMKAGLAHVQFEIIHPFLDGNGRIGRLLIVLMLIENDILLEPILYPSYYFKKHNLEYYTKLDNVRTKGDFEGWIKYYLTIIEKSSKDACLRARDLELLWERIKESIAQEKDSKKTKDAKFKTLDAIFEYPVINSKILGSKLEISYNTANKLISHFVKSGILAPEGEQKRNKLFKFIEYFKILEHDYNL